MSTIMNLPFGSEIVLRMWKERLLLKSMLTPALALERLLNIAEYPHSEVQHISLSFEQWTSCRKNIAYFLVLSHLQSQSELVIDLISQSGVAMLLLVCQLSQDVIGYEDS